MIRRLILKVACLNNQDHKWLMSNLTSEEKKHIQPLLDEVKSLGLDKDASIRKQIICDDNVLKPNNIDSDNQLADFAGFDELADFWKLCLLNSSDCSEQQKLQAKASFFLSDKMDISLPEKLAVEVKKSTLALNNVGYKL